MHSSDFLPGDFHVERSPSHPVSLTPSSSQWGSRSTCLVWCSCKYNLIICLGETGSDPFSCRDLFQSLTSFWHSFEVQPEESGGASECGKNNCRACLCCWCYAAKLIYPKKKNAESEGEVPLCPDSRDYEGGFAWASPAVSSVLLQHFSRAGNILVIDNWSWKCRIKSNRALKDQADAYPLNIAAAPSTSISQDNIIPHSTLNSVRISHNWWLYVAMHTSRTCNSPLIALLWFKLSFFFFFFQAIFKLLKWQGVHYFHEMTTFLFPSRCLEKECSGLESTGSG